jgi:hypothetical protein
MGFARLDKMYKNEGMMDVVTMRVLLNDQRMESTINEMNIST